MNTSQLIDLSSRCGFLGIEGKDAVTFLQGYTTSDLGCIDQGAQLGALTNIKGRMLTSFLVLQHEGGLLLRMDPTLVPASMEFLAKYIIFSKAEMQDLSPEWHCYGQIASQLGSLATDAHPDGADAKKAVLNRLPVDASQDMISITLPWGQEIWSRKRQAVEGSLDDWLTMEVNSGLAWVRHETSDAFLPQMLNYHQLGGVDFDKGCYLGQEIVARAQFRGELKRRLQRINNSGGLKVGDDLENGKVAAVSPTAALAVMSTKS